jgi:hypothetical protein
MLEKYVVVPEVGSSRKAVTLVLALPIARTNYRGGRHRRQERGRTRRGLRAASMSLRVRRARSRFETMQASPAGICARHGGCWRCWTSQAWSDARPLDAWLAAAGDRPTRDVVRLGPGSLRGKGGRNAAMDVLTELGRAGRARIERDGRCETLARNPPSIRGAPSRHRPCAWLSAGAD